MINFKELLISKIIAVAVIITFSVTTAAYGIDLSERNYLRVPVGQKATYERVDDTRGSLEDQKTPIDPQSDKDSKKKKIRFSDLSIPVATGLFAVVFAISFLRAEYTTAVHLFGIGVGAFLGLASVLYTFYRIRKPHSVSKSKALIKITIASCIMVANIFYTTKLRDLPHDVRVVTTKFFSLVHRINMLGGDRETKILLPSEKEIIHIKPSGARKGFRYAELDIIHKGILTFKDKLRYVVVDPKRYDIKVAHGNSTLSLVKESGAIAGINGSYISKNLTPIGLLIQDGKTLFPYTSENIEVELIDGTKMIVLSDNYFEENPPFNNIGSIKYAVQHAPDGLLIEDGKIVRDINNSYVNRLMAQEAIFAVLENGSVSIVPSDYYIKNIYPFDGSVKVIQALQTGPLTFYEGISVKSVKMNVEAVRGKVAYAIDANDNLYLLTTDSIRGIYGMTYTQFTNELIEHGKENGIQFKSIAFGDAGGSGTLTVLDEETGNYKISGAGVKYMSSSAILVFPHKTVSLEAAKEEIIDIDTISLEKLVSYSKENLKTLKIIIEQYPEKIKEFLLNSDSKEFTITIDLLINNYLSAFEEAPEKLRDMFIDIAKESPERGLMFLYALGPEYIDRVFVNYYMGDMISVEEGDKLEMIEKIIMPNVFASNPKKVAEFLEKLDRYGIDIDSLPTPLYKLPSKDFDSRDSGLWIIEFYAKYNKEALDLIDALDSVSSEVTLARLFEHLIRSHGNKVYIKLLEGLAERKGIDWVKRYIHITITQYLPPFEEYYEEFAVGIRKTINSVSKPLRQVIEKELQNIDIDIDTLKQKDMDSFKGIGRSTYIVERTMLRTDLFSDPNKDEDPQRELKALLAALKNGKIDNIPQSLYVIIAVKDVPLEDKFLVLEKLKMLVEDNIDARNGIRRISDISLLNNINQGLKDAAIDYLVSLYKHNNPIVLKDIRALLVLATQDKDLKVKAKATSFINKLNFIDIPYRLKWSHDWPWLQPHLYIKLAQ
ncbi:MAG: hypothetical protein KJ706_00150, partial [Candidatus Omnitrophica bacterium]|nr:hypothetical protein [Candidatus Omnitrophota bacterium]